MLRGGSCSLYFNEILAVSPAEYMSLLRTRVFHPAEPRVVGDRNLQNTLVNHWKYQFYFYHLVPDPCVLSDGNMVP